MRRLAALALTVAIVGCTGGSDATENPSSTPASEVDTVPDASVASTVPDTTDGASTTVTSTVPEGGGTATGALEDADVQIETDTGTIQIGVAEVPAGVSPTFPIPDDLDVQLSSATDTDFGFSGVSARSIAELAEFYDVELTAAGYVITTRQETPGLLAVYTFERNDEYGQVAISSAPGSGTSVLVTIGDGTTRTEAAVGD